MSVPSSSDSDDSNFLKGGKEFRSDSDQECRDENEDTAVRQVVIVKIKQDNSFALAKIGDVVALRERLSVRPRELNKKSSMGMTPLHGAAWNGNHDCIRLLLSLGADANIEDIDGDTPLSWACSHGNLTCVKELIANRSTNVVTKNKDGNTCFHWAAIRGHNTVLTCLLDILGDKILTMKNKEMNTPLHLAAQYGHTHTISLLKEKHNADMTCKNKEGKTAEELMLLPPLPMFHSPMSQKAKMALTAETDISVSSEAGSPLRIPNTSNANLQAQSPTQHHKHPQACCILQ